MPPSTHALDDYREMLRIRLFEERCAELKDTQEIPGSIHLGIGQEAIPVGACGHLERTDSLTATYRGHGWALARGVPAAEMFAEFLGRESSLSGGRGGSPYFTAHEHGFLGENSIVAGGMPIALGAAVAAWQQNRTDVSLVAIGDGALNQGAAHEALNFAAAWTLPLVVVVENNLYAEMTPWDAMIGVGRLSDRAAGYGMPGTTVDGNDPAVVRETVAEAVARARDGHGPSLIEAMTERLVGHYSGDAQVYRPAGEVDEARSREPLVRLRDRILQDDPSAQRQLDDTAAAVRAEIDEATEVARRRPEPDPATAREHVYA